MWSTPHLGGKGQWIFAEPTSGQRTQMVLARLGRGRSRGANERRESTETIWRPTRPADCTQSRRCDAESFMAAAHRHGSVVPTSGLAIPRRYWLEQAQLRSGSSERS